MRAMKPFHLIAAAFLVCLLGMGAFYAHELEGRNEALKEQLRARQNICEPVHVTCECLEYEEGWEDAQHVQGCDPVWDEIPIEDLRLICAELETYGYVPSC